jgi:hypothetical protein
MELCQPFGPTYPALGASVAKYRKIANPTAAQRRAHGDAIGAAIRALQRAELQRELPSFRPSCASGTWHNNADGKVGEAMRAKHHAALLAAPGNERCARTDMEWRDKYRAAMREKADAAAKAAIDRNAA